MKKWIITAFVTLALVSTGVLAIAGTKGQCMPCKTHNDCQTGLRCQSDGLCKKSPKIAADHAPKSGAILTAFGAIWTSNPS